MIIKVYLKILLIVPFCAIEFLIILSKAFFISKALRMVETCVLVNNNLCGKLFSLFESPTTFYESFKGN